jgi:hypothetical protein
MQGWLPPGSSGWGSAAQQPVIHQHQQQQAMYQAVTGTTTGAEGITLQQDYMQAASIGFPAAQDGSGAAAVPLILRPGAADAQGSLIGQQFATGGELLLLPPSGALPPGAQHLNLADINMSDIPGVLHIHPDGSLKAAPHVPITGLIGGAANWGVNMSGAGEQGQYGGSASLLLPERAARAAAAAAARRHRKQVRHTAPISPVSCWCDIWFMIACSLLTSVS